MEDQQACALLILIVAVLAKSVQPIVLLIYYIGNSTDSDEITQNSHSQTESISSQFKVCQAARWLTA